MTSVTTLKRRKFDLYFDLIDFADMFAHISEHDGVILSTSSESSVPPILSDTTEAFARQVVLISRRASLIDLTPKTMNDLEAEDPQQAKINELVRREMSSDRAAPSSSQGRYRLDVLRDPVVELILPIMRKTPPGLRAGRFYFEPKGVFDSKFVLKPEADRIFADEIFDWARSWTKRAGGKACAPHVAELVRSGAIELD